MAYVAEELRPTEQTTAPASPVVRAVGVTKRYDDGRSRPALDGVDLSIERGAFVAIMGPSGSGKSTLLHLFGVLDVPTSGDVWFEEQRVSALDDAGRTEIRRSRVGFVFQQYNLVSVLTAADNIALPLVIAKVPERERRRRLDRITELFGLSPAVLRERPTRLSGGEQQRVAIARALITDPAVILADEPTGALDTDNGRAVLQALRTACRDEGRTVVLATHDPVAAASADEIVRLRDGCIVDRHPVDPVVLDDVFRSDDT